MLVLTGEMLHVSFGVLEFFILILGKFGWSIENYLLCINVGKLAGGLCTLDDDILMKYPSYIVYL